MASRSSLGISLLPHRDAGAFSSQAAWPGDSENATNKGPSEHDPLHAKRIMLYAGRVPAAIDPVGLAARLIACPSVTPASGRVFDVLEEALTPLGFTVHRFTLGEAPDGPVENLFATRGAGAPHFAFAGHLDVVPPGGGWTSDPFTPDLRGGLLHGRGAVDMKGGIAAFVAACADADQPGTLSLIITGDEEGPATYGTPAIMD